jgi:hypothetical protein
MGSGRVPLLVGVVLGFFFGASVIAFLVNVINYSVNQFLAIGSGVSLVVFLIVALVLLLKLKVVTGVLMGVVLGIVLNVVLQAVGQGSLINQLLRTFGAR